MGSPIESEEETMSGKKKNLTINIKLLILIFQAIMVRERPPKPPTPIAPIAIVIPGKVIPPPPRKVIVERLPQLPPKPREIIIERWLGYQRRARRVNYIVVSKVN